MASYLNGVVMHFFLTLLIAVSLRATHLTVQDIAKHGRNLIIKPPEGYKGSDEITIKETSSTTPAEAIESATDDKTYPSANKV